MASLTRRERNFNMNVGSFATNRKHSEKSRWICIYPTYLNSKRTEAQGRKIPLSKAVENPTLNEIKDVLVNAKFPVEVEPGKCFPRELYKYENRGRIRVQLKNDEGSPLNESYATSEQKKFNDFLFQIQN